MTAMQALSSAIAHPGVCEAQDVNEQQANPARSLFGESAQGLLTQFSQVRKG